MRTATTTLPPEPTSSRACRRFLTATLESWGADQFADEAVLLVSELVTNAVLHAGTQITITVRLDDDGRVLRVEVRDGNPRLPAVRHYSVLSGTGRGLALLDSTASSWAVEPADSGDGKTVWFELDASRG